VTKLYGHARNLHTLEPYYSAHVSAMTSEGLHAKSDIAAELAVRDAQIVKLRSALQAARDEITNMSTAYGCGFSLAVIDDVDAALAATEPTS
jgi:hypothetical protein